MKKLISFLAISAALLVSACSQIPTKEIVTVPTVIDTPKIEAPVIQVVPRPNPVQMKDADIVIVTEANLQEVIEKIKTTQGEFVLYAMTAQSFEALALNMEQIKRFIEQQNNVILYYEKSVAPSKIIETDLE